jgi:hypothetical protein
MTRNKHKHPVSGEPIRLGEHVSWKIQFAIRRWLFIGTITALTLTCWVVGSHYAPVLLWWNLLASWLAIAIESVVGMAMFNMAQNDGKVIRKILTMEQDELTALKTILKEVEEL